MVSPYQETDEGNGQRGKGDGPVSEDGFFREGGNDLRNNTESWYNHNVHGRVRIEPEKMLVEYRISPKGRVKNTDVQNVLHS